MIKFQIRKGILIRKCNVHKLIEFDGARSRNRTGTEFNLRRILSPVCLPISPSGRRGIKNGKLYTMDYNFFRNSLLIKKLRIIKIYLQAI